MSGSTLNLGPDLRLGIGVLALQGDFAAHAAMLAELGARAQEVRRPADLEGIDGLIIPGGESTTITMGLERTGLGELIRQRHSAGMPIFGTCAGLIVCDASHLCLIDATARRNAFGRQLQSFERDVVVKGLGPEPIRAIFIRAPWVEEWGEDVEILAEHDGHPVVIREGRVLVSAFHPELAGDPRMHAMFMAMVTASREEEEAHDDEMRGRRT